jgi:hypothetical protein
MNATRTILKTDEDRNLQLALRLQDGIYSLEVIDYETGELLLHEVLTKRWAASSDFIAERGTDMWEEAISYCDM